MEPEVTVAITVHNSERHIYSCIKSLLAQTIRDFEILVVEDPPFDGTREIIERFRDERIKYVRNPSHYGLSKSRNVCIRLAKGEYIFFTDSDCMVSENWIEEGLKTFHDKDCIGVEGRTYYVSENYEPTYSDAVVENLEGGQYMTCNIAYKSEVLKRIGGFDERFTYLEDRDLAFRAMKYGEIVFNPKMVVYHQKSTITPIQYVKTAKRIRNRVLLYKKFKDRELLYGKIVAPLDLMTVIFPPLVLGSFLRNRYNSKEDFALFPFLYLRLIYERLNLWYACAKERVFLI